MYCYTFSRIVCIKYHTFSRIRYADCYTFSRIKRIILLRHGKTVPIRLSNTEHVDCTGLFATRFGPTKKTELAEPVSIACSFRCLFVVGQLLLVSS